MLLGVEDHSTSWRGPRHHSEQTLGSAPALTSPAPASQYNRSWDEGTVHLCPTFAVGEGGNTKTGKFVYGDHHSGEKNPVVCLEPWVDGDTCYLNNSYVWVSSSHACLRNQWQLSPQNVYVLCPIKRNSMSVCTQKS